MPCAVRRTRAPQLLSGLEAWHEDILHEKSDDGSCHSARERPSPSCRPRDKSCFEALLTVPKLVFTGSTLIINRSRPWVVLS